MKKSRKQHLERIARRTALRRQGREAKTLTGILHVNAGGFGFIHPQTVDDDDRTQDAFVPAAMLNNAMDGDLVKGVVLPPRSDEEAAKGTAARITEILRRGREEAVGEVLSGHKIRPLNRRLGECIELTGSFKNAKRGDWVKVKLLHNSGREGESRGTVIDRIGKAGEILSDLDAVMAEYNLIPPYTEADNDQAEQIAPASIERQDLTMLETATIDPVDAKDFDDALSIAPGTREGEVRIYVHIADVAAYATPGSWLDKEAQKRGFTTYLPGRTLPMLPKKLTAKISLQAGAISFAHTVELLVEKSSGKVLSSRRYHASIRVDKRLNYDEVQSFLDANGQNAPSDWSGKLCSMLRELAECTRAMRRFREKTEEFIDL
ncbi:MAG: RNB domain-containing ribonuclease, partial [Victivallaceae bacterium]|nr:RNB domain-containing ribonuclease [Victivallaceae bacterium]